MCGKIIKLAIYLYSRIFNSQLCIRPLKIIFLLNIFSEHISIKQEFISVLSIKFMLRLLMKYIKIKSD